RATSRQPAAASRSAFPAVCTAPACDAKPHGYPSYYPLRLTVGLDKGKVNAKPTMGRYPSNRTIGRKRDVSGPQTGSPNQDRLRAVEMVLRRVRLDAIIEPLPQRPESHQLDQAAFP